MTQQMCHMCFETYKQYITLAPHPVGIVLYKIYTVVTSGVAVPLYMELRDKEYNQAYALMDIYSLLLFSLSVMVMEFIQSNFADAEFVQSIL